ncbi:MAG TPA: urease accessory protein UreD [Verrucomicrobiae bacterium]|jgi:urease accessory protein
MTGNAGFMVNKVAGKSAVTESWCRNPLKILTPCPRGPTVSAYLSSFGGGLVAGDQTSLTLNLGAGARCFLTTQASTKVYRNPAQKPCSHELIAQLADDSLLVIAPDPVQSFADSSYRQSQKFSLHSTAGLVLLDWFCSGRAARGERWSFQRLQSRNEIFVNGELRLLDSLILDRSHGSIAGKHRLGRFNCVAMVAILGSQLKDHARALLQHMESRPVERGSSLLFSASPIRDGAVFRVAGESHEEVGHHIHHSLRFMRGLLQDDPWHRKFRNN